MMTLLHVLFGTLALVVAPAAVIARKGGSWHRRCGLAFIFAMAIVLFSSGFLWQAQGHIFLLPLAAVSGYLLFSGYRTLVRHRRRVADPIEDGIDMLAAGAVLLAAAGLVYLAATAATPLTLTIRPALTGIATIAAAFACNELLGFAAPRMRFGWLLTHVAGMIAAYISAVTAFVVINAHDVPMMVRWVLPSLAGGAVIVVYTLRALARPRIADHFRKPVATATAPVDRFVIH